jgi:hypothetical protein
MADRIRSISAQQLANEVKEAVAKNEELKGRIVDPKVAMIPPWVIGIILPPADLKNQSIGGVQKLAASIAKSLPSAHGREPAAVVHGGHVLLGFVENPTATFFEE